MKRRILSAFFVLALCCSLTVSVLSIQSFAEARFGDVPTDTVYDGADILTDEEEVLLTQKLLAVSSTYDAQVVVYTVSSVAGDIDWYTEQLFDSMGFGYGEGHDGVLLMVCMNPRQYRILSNGSVNNAIADGEIEEIGDAIESDLSAGNYADAFDEFAEQCDYYLDGYINGFPFDFGINLLIALGIGIAAGLVVALILRGQLKSVRRQDQANAYVKSGSMQITQRSDLFLYRTVSRVKRQTSSSSKSGSSRSIGGGSF